MTQSRTRNWWFALIVLAIVAAYIGYFSRPITPPQGDGRFQDLSGWIGPFPDRGYHIKFPQFDLSQSFTAEYRIAGLTDVGHPCDFYLIMIDKDGRWSGSRDYSQVGGRLTMQMVSVSGKPVVTVDGPLGSYVWWRSRDKQGLYQLDESHFIPDPREAYVIKIKYEPAAEVEGMRGYVYLNTGAKYSGPRRRLRDED